MQRDGIEPIYDRSKEHLGTTDSMVIAVRRMLLRAAKNLRDEGDPAGERRQRQPRPRAPRRRSILPEGADWVTLTEDIRSSEGGRSIAHEMRPLHETEAGQGLVIAPEQVAG